ncbi:MAG TPA: sugar phosphate nucleotidyltransferase [Bacillota bacterium]|nr:sugar phosphate nucleotidyltransferase [Bacillota bacterium]
MRTAVILSGGLGTRLRPFTSVIPKPLMPVGEKAILEVQIERLHNSGFDRIVLATNYKSDYIEKFLGNGARYGVELIISKEDSPLGTAGPLKLISDYLTEPFIVMNGDILTDLSFEDFYTAGCNNDSLLTVCIKKIVMPYSFGNIEFDGDIVTRIVEKPDIITYALAGIYCMKPEILSLIPDGYFGMDKLMLSMFEKQFKINKFDISGYWLDIGRSDDYEKAQELFGKQ